MIVHTFDVRYHFVKPVGNRFLIRFFFYCILSNVFLSNVIGRDVLRHITNCKLEENCSDARCKTSRQILSHWELCSKTQLYCKVCSPLKVVKFRKSKRFEVPDCLAARAIIDHYKECTSMECERCNNVKDLRRKVYGSRGLVKRRICHSALLKHSCRCQDRTCQIPMCIKMKRVLTHTNICQGKTAQSMVCQDIATFCLNHAIVCTEKDCILSTNRVNA